MNEAQRLSRLLWDAREQLEMHADMMVARYGEASASFTRQILLEVDAYRAEQGWSPNGFGHEEPSPLEKARQILNRDPWLKCEKHPDDDPVKCGWKRVVYDLRAVLGAK